MSEFLGSSASRKVRTWEHGPGTLCNSFCHATFRTLREFGKGVSEKALYLEVPGLGCSFSVSEAKSNIPGNTRHVPPKTLFLKLPFRTYD